MTEDDEPDLYRGILRFAQARNEAMARKVIYRLQREKATGIFGDDYTFKSLWDEYCHDCQNGPYFDDFDDPLGETVSGYIAAVIDAADPDEMRLLSLANPEAFDIDIIDHDFLVSEVASVLAGIAGSRNLERFENS